MVLLGFLDVEHWIVIMIINVLNLVKFILFVFVICDKVHKA